MLVADVTGDLPEIVGNEERLYEGDLSLYFRILFFESSNLNNPYHNFRHTLHVVWLCHKACLYYQEQLTPRQMRNLLIAAIFHDFDHPGHPHRGEEDPDRINIDIAIAGLRRYILSSDYLCLPENPTIRNPRCRRHRRSTRRLLRRARSRRSDPDPDNLRLKPCRTELLGPAQRAPALSA